MNFLVVDCTKSPTNSAYYSPYWPSTNQFIKNFNATSLFGHPITDYYCLYSFYGINRPFGSTSYFLFTNDTQDIVNTNSSANQHDVTPFCIVSCPSISFVDYSLNVSACIPCDIPILNCLTCNSKTECLVCKPIAALINKGCTNCHLLIEYCNTCLNTTACTKCFSGRLV